ncbi:MAG: hypothetical protein ABNH16_07145 [Thalassolituus sp.]|jgi:hypothetical protein
MNEVKLNKIDLLQVLKDNLAKHTAEVAELRSERTGKVLDHMESELEKALSDANYQPVTKDFPMIESHEGDYKKVIRMVEMSVDEAITLDSRSFDQYVMDNWAWKSALDFTKTLYGKGA